MMNRFRNFFCTLSLLAASFFLLVVQTNAADDTPPNILIIVADDLGYSDLGSYGGEIETPRLDALAEGGVRLTRFYNTGRCCPSRAAILTGQYPHRVGFGHMVQDLGQPGYTGRLPEEAVTIAQVLAPAGYRSFLAGKWHVGGEDPTRHGFEEFYGTLVSAKTFWDPHHFLRLPADRPRREYAEGEYYATDAVTDHALDFLGLARQTPERPWFLYLAYSAPHFPLHAPPEDIAKYADRYTIGWDAIRDERLARMKELGIVPSDTPLSPRSRFWDWGESEPGVNPAWEELPRDRRADLARRMAIYAAMVDRMDRNIGRVVDDLRAAGELDDTLIVFLSDNGACAEWDPHGFDIRSSANNMLHAEAELEQMGGPGTFHSVGTGWANASNTPWRLYKHYNHEGGVASPCIVHWPARLAGGGQILHDPAHIIDLMPTAIEASGATYPRGETLPLPGRSLLPLVAGEATEPRTLYFEHEGNRAVLDGNWKLVAVRGGEWELYDTEADRVELRDLFNQHPDVARRLADKWNRWAEENSVTPLPRDYRVGYLLAAAQEKRLPERQGTLWYPATEWAIEAPVPDGANPFDVEVSATFVHEESGEEITTGLFYAGDGTWKFRFTGPKVGVWRFATKSDLGALGEYRGTVEIQPNPAPYARGFVSHAQEKWQWSGSQDVFVPQLVMYKDPQEYLNDAEGIDADIHKWIEQHGFNGFHTVVLTRWFDIHKQSSDQFDTSDPNPDPRTFDALELLITRVYEAGGMVHIWAWGDDSRHQTAARWGLNGAADRRLQRYIAARLGPLPGWTMGYGFDLWEWVSGEQLTAWHTHMHRHFGWPHLLGARADKNQLTQLSEELDYSSYEQHRPDYDLYRRTIEARPDRPSFSEDRFRVRENSSYPEKDYTPELTRRGLWHSTMAGGVANIWGYLVSGAEDGYPNREQITTYARFFDGRFLFGMQPCNERTDYEKGVTLSEGDLRVCLGDAAAARFVFYAENTDQVRMDLRGMKGPQPAVAVDTLKPYQELALEPLGPDNHLWKAPYKSTWAIAVGTFADAARD